MANILGGSKDDLLNGTVNNDTINGGSGNDTIYGGGGSDSLIGGRGSDLLYAGIGNDMIDGGSENDTIDGGSGNDTILGGSGNDVIFADTGQSTKQNFIQNGSFELLNGSQTPEPWGFSAPSIPSWMLDSGPAFEIVDTGHRGINASDGSYWLDMDASAGNIQISQTIAVLEIGQSYQLRFNAADSNAGGGAANNLMVYFGGVLVGPALGALTTTMQTYGLDIFGGAGDGSNKLTFVGTGAADSIGLSLDNVRLLSNADTDGLHNDSIDGGSGQDFINGEAGNDTINGGSENDVIAGGTGNDSLLGGSSGADTLIGGNGADTMNGGSGADVFKYDSLSDSTVASRDLIKGWDVADIINVSGLGFTGVTAGAAVGTTLGYTISAGNTIITAATSDFSITIEGIQTLTNADFIYA